MSAAQTLSAPRGIVTIVPAVACASQAAVAYRDMSREAVRWGRMARAISLRPD